MFLLSLRSRISLENDLLQDETPREDGSTIEKPASSAPNKIESSGEGGGSGAEEHDNSLHEDRLPKRSGIPKPTILKRKNLQVGEKQFNNKEKVVNKLNDQPRSLQNSVQDQMKSLEGSKVDTAAELPKTDRRFTKLIGSRVACRLVGKKGFKEGSLRWVGHLPNLPADNAHLIAGVELSSDDKLGTDGTYRGVRYFKSESRRGYFFRLNDCKAMKH